MTLWDSLQKPIFALAPMEDVTDTVFRQILCGAGKPDVFFTEFTNVDGIASQGHDVVARRLQYSKAEHPIIAQIWGMDPGNYYKVAKELAEKGFDGIDINMGCPQHDVIRHGACSALMKNRGLATEIIRATQEGAGDLPVSVKTRIGFTSMITEDWIGFLLEHNLSLITVHGRTASEMSKVPCHWDEIGKAVSLRDEWEKKNHSSSNEAESRVEKLAYGKLDKVSTHYIRSNKKPEIASLSSQKEAAPEFSSRSWTSQSDRSKNHHTLVFGNGDVMSLQEAKEKVEKYHVDGVMIGRGVLHNPWLFADSDPKEKTLKERLMILEQHVKLFERTWGNAKSFQLLKKYFKIYLSDFEGAADVRMKFMECVDFQSVYKLCTAIES